MTFIDYYKILGIERKDTGTDIKSACRKLARKYHPDLNPNDTDAQKNSQQINEAEISFIYLLQQNGLIKTRIIESNCFIEKEQLPQLEKFVRFHYELDINLEGIETITYLLQRIENLQNDNIKLKNRLRLYEG